MKDDRHVVGVPGSVTPLSRRDTCTTPNTTRRHLFLSSCLSSSPTSHDGSCKSQLRRLQVDHTWLDASRINHFAATVVSQFSSVSATHVNYLETHLRCKLQAVCDRRTFYRRHFLPLDKFPPPTQDIPPTVKAKIWNLALTHTPDPNRSTAINFVDVNGKSLYIEDWRMVVVVEGGNVLHHAKRKGDFPGRGMSGGICPGGNVRTSVLYVS